MRCRAVFYFLHLVYVFGGIDVPRAPPQQEEDIPFGFEVEGHLVFYPLQQPYHPDSRRGIHGSIGILVVEADISTRDRRVETAAGISHPLDGIDELVVYLGVIRIPEVETV